VQHRPGGRAEGLADRLPAADLARTLHGERYLREQQARTELARINRELKQLSAQLAALEERRAALLSELGEHGSPRPPANP
jgi:chromosome segregation ATPase